MTGSSSAEVDWAVADGAILAPISMMANRPPNNGDSVSFMVFAPFFQNACAQQKPFLFAAIVNASRLSLLRLALYNLSIRSHYIETAESVQRGQVRSGSTAVVSGVPALGLLLLDDPTLPGRVGTSCWCQSRPNAVQQSG